MKPLKNCVFAGALMTILALPAFAQGKKGAGAAAPSASSATPAPSSSSAAFESQMLAYGALDHIARHIAKKSCSLKGTNGELIINNNSTIVIFDQPSFATLQSYQAFIANVNVLVAAYKTLFPADANDSSGESLVDWKSFFHQKHKEFEAKAKDKSVPAEEQKSMSDFADLLKRDEFSAMFGLAPTEPVGATTSLLSAIAVSSNSESAGSITIPDSAMAIALVREFKDKNNCTATPTIIYPPLFGHGSSSDFSSEDIQLQIEELDYIRQKAHQFIDKANEAFIVAHPGSAATPSGPATSSAPAIPAKPATAGPNNPVLTAALAGINGLYDSFMNSLLQVNSSTGTIGSASVIQGYQLATVLAGRKAIVAIPFEGEEIAKSEAVPGAYVLLANVVAAGGTERVHKSFWTALTTGDRITYSGGAIVNLSLWQATAGSPVYNSQVRYRSPFMKMKAPADITGLDSGDNLKPE